MTKLLLSLLALALCGPAEAAPDYKSQSSSSGLIIGNNAVLSAPSNSAFPLVCTLGQPCVLGVLRGANFAVTTDNIIPIAPLTAFNAGQLPAATKYLVTGFYATNCSAASNAAVGGLYTAATKGGTAIVAAGQTYAGCTSVALSLTTATLAAAATTSLYSGASLFFSLTTIGSGTGDVYVLGIPLN